MADVWERCTVCRALLDEEDLFCTNCGTESPSRPEVVATTSFKSTHNFNCDGCGAAMSYDASAQTLRCPFCGSEKLSEQKDQTAIRPNRVIPFSITCEQATKSLRAWLKDGFWRPSDLSDAAIVTKMSAVFVPYWVFSARAHSYWTADSSATPLGASGDWVPMFGEHHGEYHGLLIGASSALTPAETSGICPFDLAQGVSPDQVDLDAAVYEQFRVQRKYARPLAQHGFEQRIAEECTQKVPGRCRKMQINTKLEGLTSEAIFVPVWIMAYRYDERQFRFLINGQTGKATGQAPTSWKKILAVVGMVIGGLILAALAVALFAGLAAL